MDFNITQGIALLLLRPLDLPANFVLNLIIYITNPKNNIGYQSKTNNKFNNKLASDWQIDINHNKTQKVKVLILLFKFGILTILKFSR